MRTIKLLESVAKTRQERKESICKCAEYGKKYAEDGKKYAEYVMKYAEYAIKCAEYDNTYAE